MVKSECSYRTELNNVSVAEVIHYVIAFCLCQQQKHIQGPHMFPKSRIYIWDDRFLQF